MTEPDFSGVAPAAASEDHLQMLVTMAQTLREKIRAVDDATTELARLQDDLNKFQLSTIPEAMELAGVAEFKLADGCVLKVKDDLKASITIENRPYAHAWLRDHGHGGVIKAGITVDLRSLTDEDRAKVKEELRAHELEPEDIESVHPATLKSLVKELLEKGTTLPPSIGVFQFKKAELKEAKGKK